MNEEEEQKDYDLISKDPKFNASLAVLQSIHYHLEYATIHFCNYDFERCYLQLKTAFWFSAPILPKHRKEEIKKIFENAERERNEYNRWQYLYSKLSVQKRPNYEGHFHSMLEQIAELIPQALMEAKIYFSLEDKSDLLKPEEEW